MEQYLFGGLTLFRRATAERHVLVGLYITDKYIQPKVAEVVNSCNHFSKNDFAYF